MSDSSESYIRSATHRLLDNDGMIYRTIH